MVDKKKEIDTHRFYWNPEIGEKQYSHYMDGTEIKVDEAFKAAAKVACGKKLQKQLDADPKMRDKPVHKRKGLKKAPIEVATSKPAEVKK